jgi:hypothetical protein
MVTKPPSPALAPGGRGGSLTSLVCDIKRPLAGEDARPPLDIANFVAVLDAFRSRLGCDVLRIYIDPQRDDPATYPPLYTSVLARARSLGMRIYANPLGTGRFGKDPATYARWIAAYANAVHPDYLGPFNESGMRAKELDDIARRVRGLVAAGSVLVGPDAQKVEHTEQILRELPALSSDFDIFTSHNAVDDDSATAAGWTALAHAAGRATWATENPRPLHATNPGGEEVGVASVLASPVAGLVLYEAFPSSVNADGSLTAKGAALAAAIQPGGAGKRN